MFSGSSPIPLGSFFTGISRAALIAGGASFAWRAVEAMTENAAVLDFVCYEDAIPIGIHTVLDPNPTVFATTRTWRVHSPDERCVTSLAFFAWEARHALQTGGARGAWKPIADNLAPLELTFGQGAISVDVSPVAQELSSGRTVAANRLVYHRNEAGCAICTWRPDRAILARWPCSAIFAFRARQPLRTLLALCASDTIAHVLGSIDFEQFEIAVAISVFAKE